MTTKRQSSTIDGESLESEFSARRVQYSDMIKPSTSESGAYPPGLVVEKAHSEHVQICQAFQELTNDLLMWTFRSSGSWSGGQPSVMNQISKSDWVYQNHHSTFNFLMHSAEYCKFCRLICAAGSKGEILKTTIITTLSYVGLALVKATGSGVNSA